MNINKMVTPILKELKTSELVVDEFNARSNEWNPLDDDETKLIDSIKAQGVLEPILVRTVKGQASKYKKGKTYSIICGNRRYHAAMEARLKTIPSVIRNDIDDIGALGTSIQENLKRRSMDKTTTADAVGRMMEMMNGNRTYEQKMRDMNKIFGMKERSIYNYWNIYKLKKEIGKSNVLQPAAKKIDTDTLASIQTVKHWNIEDKEKAMKVLSEIDDVKDRRATLSELKERTKADEDLGIGEAFKKIEEEYDDNVGQSFDIYLSAKERKATKEAALKEKLEINTLIKRSHTIWLKENGYL